MSEAAASPTPLPRERDYVGEMRALLDAEAAKSTDPAPVIAERVVRKLRTTDPDLLSGWLHANAHTFVREAIGAAARSVRSHLRQTQGRGVFAGDAEAFKSGDAEAMDRWLDATYRVEGGVRKPLRDMTSADLLWKADEYEKTERDAAMEKAFLRAIAKKVGKSTVGERLTEEQIRTIRKALEA